MTILDKTVLVMFCGIKELRILFVFDANSCSDDESTEREPERNNIAEIFEGAFCKARVIAERSVSKPGVQSGSLRG